MAMTAAEQYALELLNRARLDPVAEARRFGIGLNNGVDADDRITAAPMQVLAYSAMAERAALMHANWMIANDVFSHRQGGDNDSVYDRMLNVGYVFGGATWGYGENLVAVTSNGMSATAIMNEFHKLWMLSPGHRANMLADSFREIGYTHVEGDLLGLDQVGVEVFGWAANRVYVTGVAYNDKNKDAFYSIGEGTGGAVFRIEDGATGRSTATGGYQVLGSLGDVVVRVTAAGAIASTRLGLDLSDGNVKVDLVNGTLLKVSGDATLLSGPVLNLQALGISGISLTGQEGRNALTGNAGANVISGKAGADRLWGEGGHDRLFGGDHGDQLVGGAGNDRLSGDGGNDRLSGDSGNDWLSGGQGADLLKGGAGADIFVFMARDGADIIADFTRSQGDVLRIDDALWRAAAGTLTATQIINRFADMTADGVLFDFGGGNTLLLDGVTSTKSLAAGIEII